MSSAFLPTSMIGQPRLPPSADMAAIPDPQKMSRTDGDGRSHQRMQLQGSILQNSVSSEKNPD
jgi:hypothetical protein